MTSRMTDTSVAGQKALAAIMDNDLATARMWLTEETASDLALLEAAVAELRIAVVDAYNQRMAQ